MSVDVQKVSVDHPFGLNAMTQFIIRLVVGAAFMAVGGCFLLHQIHRVRIEEKNRSRTPFKEKLLRSPGESLSLRINQIYDEFLDRVVVLSFGVMCPGLAILIFSGTNWVSWAMTVGLAVITGMVLWIYQWPKVRRLRNDLRNHRMAFDGERYVAEKLGVLAMQGYRTFHDFRFTMKAGGSGSDFNIDHISVGPAGVFAIETKTLRQPLGVLEGDQKSHQVRLVGEELIFPKGYRTSKPVRQAKRAAADLSQWLTGTSPNPVLVVPVVAMPGWFVEDDRAGDVRVVNAKGLPKLLPHLGKGEVLNEDEIRILSDRIEAHCRDVEGSD